LAREKIQAFEKGVRNTSNILSVIAAGLLFVLMALGACDVIGRYVFNKPITGTQEMGQVFLALMVFLAWGYTQLAKAHVNVELFLRRFPSRVQAIINLATTFLALVLFGLIVWQGVITAKLYHDAGRLIYTVLWPLAPFQLFVSLGALVLCLVFVTEMIQLFLQIKGGD
jgi:TRAP-type C4-dicarboxylate transport system permease small subunit